MNQAQKDVMEYATFYLNFMRKHNLRIPKPPPADPRAGDPPIPYDRDPYITEEEYIARTERQLHFLS